MGLGLHGHHLVTGAWGAGAQRARASARAHLHTVHGVGPVGGVAHVVREKHAAPLKVGVPAAGVALVGFEAGDAGAGGEQDGKHQHRDGGAPEPRALAVAVSPIVAVGAGLRAVVGGPHRVLALVQEAALLLAPVVRVAGAADLVQHRAVAAGGALAAVVRVARRAAPVVPGARPALEVGVAVGHVRAVLVAATCHRALGQIRRPAGYRGRARGRAVPSCRRVLQGLRGIHRYRHCHRHGLRDRGGGGGGDGDGWRGGREEKLILAAGRGGREAGGRVRGREAVDIRRGWGGGVGSLQ
mmetsp:Transcript_47661/g.90978  ORF Transcript_47661/g.90978 Transcript_47661/m.90978 type:complete len:298 (+) Transcript_47661:806-1699(+)